MRKPDIKQTRESWVHWSLPSLHVGSMEGPTAHIWKGFMALFTDEAYRIQSMDPIMDLGALFPFLRSPLLPRDAAKPMVWAPWPSRSKPCCCHEHSCTQIPISHQHTSGGMHLTWQMFLQRRVPVGMVPVVPGCGTCSLFSDVKCLCSLNMMLVKKE